MDQQKDYVLMPSWVFILCFLVFIQSRYMSHQAALCCMIVILFFGKLVGNRKQNPERPRYKIHKDEIFDVISLGVGIAGLALIVVFKLIFKEHAFSL